jgi:hypothetical protein
MFQIKGVEKNQNTHFVFSNFCFSENLAVYRIMSRNLVKPEKTRTVWRNRVAYWISKPSRARQHTPAFVRSQPFIRPPTFPPTHRHTRTRMPSTRARVHTHTHTRNTLLSTVVVVSRMRLSFTVHVHCLSCFVSLRHC